MSSTTPSPIKSDSADHARLVTLAARAIEVGAFEIGPDGLRRYVRVLQAIDGGFDLFLVEDFTKYDDEEQEASTFWQFANVTLAFQHAVQLAQEEIADVCDTLEG